MNVFYQAIEEPIKDIVRTLRDNGINSTCSCGHDMYVEADIISDGTLMVIHKTLFNYLSQAGKEVKYTITITLEQNIAGLSRCFAHILIGEPITGKDIEV